MRMIAALVVVAMASLSFVTILGLRIALLAVRAAILIRRGRRAGTPLMGASLDWIGSGIGHKLKPLVY
jgi:hypothetical protein